MIPNVLIDLCLNQYMYLFNNADKPQHSDSYGLAIQIITSEPFKASE